MTLRGSIPLPPDEEERVRALRALRIVGTAPEAAYDDVVELAAAVCDAPIAAMTLIDSDRQWLKAKVGLTAEHTPRDEAFCAYAILQDDMFVVPDTSVDERFSMMPAARQGLRFYAGSPIRSPDGYKLGMLCVLDRQVRTLTLEQKTSLTALRRTIETTLELRKVNMELLRLQAQKRELTDLVVHDLKSPISSILPNAAYIERSPGISEDAREAARDIVGATRSMLGLVMNLLDISRAEEAALVPQRTSVDVRWLIAEVGAALAPRAAERNIQLASAIADGVTVASIDRDLTRRILENLADNALKYARRGRVTFGAQREGGDLLLSVEDQGPGISAQDRERIFDKYVRCDGAPHSGTSRGLGLAFCRLAAEAHGGEMWVEDVEPQGARFRVRMPGC